MATRLQCFSLISSIETDFRRFLASVLTASGIPTFLADDMRKIAKDRKTKNDTAADASASDDDFSLLEYLDFGHLGQLAQVHKTIIPEETRSLALTAARGFEPLIKVRNRVCHSRPLEFDDFSRLHDFAGAQLASAFPWDELRSTLRALAESPGMLLQLSIPSYWKDADTDLPNNLPAPDFEDTGFVGRKNDFDNLKRLVVGPYPVISVIGEGGVGKSALALRVLYDLLEDESNAPFQMIVWVSLKAAVLTATGVDQIRGAITNVLGMFNAVARELGVPQPEKQSMSNVTKEIAEYMREFRILVAIDNLETVSAEPVIQFLRHLPSGSKVLITSRIGLGQLEHAYPLAPMDERDATNFFRRAAGAQNLKDLKQAKKEAVEKWCRRLSYSPLAIKWFVAAIALGQEPEVLLGRHSRPYKDLLTFSFENLFGSLSETQRLIVRTIHSASVSLTRTQLIFLLESLSPKLSGDEIDLSLREKAERALPQFSETRRIRAMVLRGGGDMVRAKDEYEACLELDAGSRIGRYAFAFFLLNDMQDYESALGIASSLQKDDPKEFAPKSLVAIILQRSGRLMEAVERYEDLLRYLGDATPRVRVMIRDQAAETYRRISELDSRRKERSLFKQHIGRAIDIILESLSSEGAADARTRDRFERILSEALEESIRTRDALLAQWISDRLNQAIDILPQRLNVAVRKVDFLEVCSAGSCMDLASRFIDTPAVAQERDPGRISDASGLVERIEGRVRRLVGAGSYGFLADNAGQEWFFHRNNFRVLSQWDLLQIGSRLEFSKGQNSQGRCAIEIQLLT